MEQVEVNLDAKLDYERFNLTKERALELITSIGTKGAVHPLEEGDLSFNVFLQAAIKAAKTQEELLFLVFMCGRTKQVGEAILHMQSLNGEF